MKTMTNSRRPIRHDERGMALAIALFAIVVIGALVAGTTFAGRVEMVGGRSALQATHALEQAETGVATAFANWNATWNSLAISPANGSSTAGPSDVTGTDQYTTSVTRLNDNLFLVQSAGSRSSAGGVLLSSRALAQLARLNTPTISVDAALEGMGDVRLTGTSTVSGLDENPAGWTGGTCTGPLTNVPGVRASGDVDSRGGSQILGSGTPPYVEYDTTVTAQDFTDIYDALVGAANKTLPSGNFNNLWPDTLAVPVGSPVGTRGACDRLDVDNWGEPGDPLETPIISQCRSYMPVIRVLGNANINTGKGQGILIVEGDLSIQGKFIFDGIIMATGNIDFRGTGAASSRVYGALFSANTVDIGDLILVSGAPVITYSSCAVAAALAGAAVGIPLAQRGWAQIY